MDVFGIEVYEEDYEFDPNWGPFDCLLEVARVCREKLMKEESMKINRPRRYEKMKYFENNALKLKGVVEEEAIGFKNDQKRLNNKNSGLKRKPESWKKNQEQEEVGLKSKRSKVNVPVCANPPPELHENIKQHIVGKMGGSDWLLVIQKPIYYSDINPVAARFSIPFSQIQTHEFLHREEAEDLNEKKAMEVKFLDPSLKETTLTFKKWSMGKSSTYNLTKKWNEVVKNNQLNVDDVVQLWSFRVESKLCFALVKFNINGAQQGREEGVGHSHSNCNEKDASSSHQEEEFVGCTRMCCEKWFWRNATRFAAKEKPR
ncbi:hypothetical protein DITRI_Ditri04bG0165500 [Diplodiscus trichospermus]